MYCILFYFSPQTDSAIQTDSNNEFYKKKKISKPEEQ